MDAQKFDAVARRLGQVRPRRRVLTTLVALPLLGGLVTGASRLPGGLGGDLPAVPLLDGQVSETDAKKKRKKKFLCLDGQTIKQPRKKKKKKKLFKLGATRGACPGTCTPATCASLNKTCGTWDDGCGGTLNCGTCAGSAICIAEGTECCTPTTCTSPCTRCGTVSDGCGGTLECAPCNGAPVPTCTPPRNS